MKRLNKKNITALLIRLQDECDLHANSLATQAVKDFGLTREHMKQTGNPKSAYALARRH